MSSDKFIGHFPCPHCKSTNNVGMYSNGIGKCYGCGKTVFQDQIDPNVESKYKPQSQDRDMTQESLTDIANYDSRGVQERQITKKVSEFYDMRVSYKDDGSISTHYYPYTCKNKIVGYKKRTLPKDFRAVGSLKDPALELFGQSKFQGGGLRLTITEGELDAMAVQQAMVSKYNREYPVVSLPSSSNMKILVANREWIRSFKEVILMFDDDDAGRKAVEEAAKIIGWDKTKVASLPENDPCDTLIKHGWQAIVEAIFNARLFTPASIVAGESIWEAYLERKQVESVPYPKCLQGLNDKLDGMRKGEIVLFTSGTGSGKSTMIKEIILELEDNTDDKIGLVSLEESIGDSAEKFIKMFTPESPSIEQERAAFERVFGNERLILLDHNGAVSDSSLIDQIENLCLLGCEYIILDHITIAVSEGADGKTGNEAIDAIMSDLLKIVKKHNVWLGLISHLRKSQGKSFEEGHLSSIDDIKGSGSIKQISFDIITFSRNLIAESDEERNTIHLRVLKSRFTGRTGDCGSAYYDSKTKRLKGLIDFEDYQPDL